jgi:hypothetical protein
MKKTKKRIVSVKEVDTTTVELEVTESFLEFYKKETGHANVTQKGLTKFINRLVELHQG